MRTTTITVIAAAVCIAAVGITVPAAAATASGHATTAASAAARSSAPAAGRTPSATTPSSASPSATPWSATASATPSAAAAAKSSTAATAKPSAAGPARTATAKAPAPTALTATPLPLASARATFGSALIHWTKPEGAQGAWVVSRNGTDSLGIGPQSISTTSANDTALVLNHLVRGRTYTVTVTGDLGQGRSASTTVRVGSDQVTPPRALVVTRNDENARVGTVSAAWAAPQVSAGKKVLGYQVTVQQLATGAAPTVVVLAPSARSYTSGELDSTFTYLVSVSAITSSGVGPAAQGSIQIGDSNKLYP
ncbi:fibronectin type III domain-containing protein [Curtobacterium sp. MCBD17_028]|uniref:fibronectin type III domain-containing protein n=1 Tax=Curtobacterium sp. MCBD17_028 TaxID=2175670 RepID=UPI000DAABBD9|nr:fibronectin type III domain-containing protein [Curtobacterium sp. MCBD17_028]PZE30108.1 hypothetical protein DEI86_02275 [Curtobacterium sp. MCBD17_028]